LSAVTHVVDVLSSSVEFIYSFPCSDQLILAGEAMERRSFFFLVSNGGVKLRMPSTERISHGTGGSFFFDKNA
jgi:hypothetical protein